MRVFVKNMRGEALMPCKVRKARILLKQKKAKIVGYRPFTIQLQYASGEAKQEIVFGVRENFQYVGMAMVSQGKVLAKGEVELRQDVSSLLKTRAIYRRGRRFRQTRYRQQRLRNRRRKAGWLTPSVQAKIAANFRWIDVFRALVPEPQLRIAMPNFTEIEAKKFSPVLRTLRKRTELRYPEAEIGDSLGLAALCEAWQLERTPYNLALAVTGAQPVSEDNAAYFYIKQFRKKKRSLHEAVARRGRKEPNRTQRRNGKNTKFWRGWYLNDEVQYLGKRGWLTGFTGVSAYVLDITGRYLQIPGRKYKMITLSRLRLVCHNNNWQYAILPG